MNKLEKRQIADKLAEYCTRFAGKNDKGQNKAANSLKGVSAATITQILSENWELVSDAMWRNIASQTGYSFAEWHSVETTDYRILHKLLNDAKTDYQVFAITGAAGTGKSFAMRRYSEANKQVYMLTCAEYWNKKQFLQELLEAMGRDCAGCTISEMMGAAVSELLRQENPLIILDEADKLPDHVFYLFITLYNQLEERCGIVLCATNYLEKRIQRGISLNKKGYNEIHSRIGHNCIPLNGASARDITSICVANGITDKEQVKGVIDDSEGDLRRVRRKIYALLKSL
jgi:DNA transposition AAA+ family ATPase